MQVSPHDLTCMKDFIRLNSNACDISYNVLDLTNDDTVKLRFRQQLGQQHFVA